MNEFSNINYRIYKINIYKNFAQKIEFIKIYNYYTIIILYHYFKEKLQLKKIEMRNDLSKYFKKNLYTIKFLHSFC